MNPWFVAAEYGRRRMLSSGYVEGFFSCRCMRLEVLGGVVVVANGWAESRRWRLRMLCDLPQRFERCYSAEDRMFDGLQACIIVIL